ncbi:MAG: alpha/beta-hydrolase family protein [Pseudohongiellaceae bacterium]
MKRGSLRVANATGFLRVIRLYNRWTTRRLLRRAGGYFHTTGLLVGTVFFAMSLAPSLLPREDAVQGVISGLSLAAGYGTGVVGWWIWSYFQLPVATPRVQWRIGLVATILCVLLAVASLMRASVWQNSLRELMGMDPVSGVQATVVGLVALLVFLAALLVARLFQRTLLYLSRRLQRFVPPRISYLIGALAALVLFWSIIDGVLFSLALQAADRSYQRIDALIDPEIEPPRNPLRTGSETSMLDWEQLGRQGRRFLSSGPRAEDIAEFTDGVAREPIRIYVGLNSAETPEERAELALAELQRVNAFDRSVLVIMTPTGTGWIDPASIDTLEYLHRGDVATVAAQYSYLPSPLALMQEGEYGVDMARALFQAIYRHWSALPADQRPDMYLQGMSLGALNSDRSFDFYDIIDDPFDGALWIGPPFRSETWRDVTQRRDPGSPAWLPRFRGGEVVRFANQQGGMGEASADWGSFRIAFLQYASDPVTFFDPRTFYREPDWMAGERAPDVSDDLRWFPIVTGLQLAADMAFGTAPEGYGHQYAPEHYHDAWLALTGPGGWSDASLQRLREMHRAGGGYRIIMEPTILNAPR